MKLNFMPTSYRFVLLADIHPGFCFCKHDDVRTVYMKSTAPDRSDAVVVMDLTTGARFIMTNDAQVIPVEAELNVTKIGA